MLPEREENRTNLLQMFRPGLAEYENIIKKHKNAPAQKGL